MDFERIGDKIKRLLMEKTYRAQTKQGSVWVCCPFHEERTPSCPVTIHHPKFPPGTFHCFGCGVKGDWNKLAEKLGIKFRIDRKELQEHMKATLRFQPMEMAPQAASTTEEFLETNNRFESFTKWPTGVKWRGVSYEFLQSINAYMLLSQDYNIERDDVKFEQLIFLPVKVNGVIVGGISAPLDRKKYLNTPGDWVKKRGLFPFDVSKKLLKNFDKKFVVIVEGPRDAARLIQAGIPALAILGAKNWTEQKRDLIHTIAQDDLDLVLLFDSDEAGQNAYKMVKASCKEYFNCLKVKLPEFTEENGETVKCDVFNLGDKRFENLVRKLKAKYE